MIHVSNNVNVRKARIDGAEQEDSGEELTVTSHWNQPDYVVLAFGDLEIEVQAADLKCAIDNATNSNRHG